MDVSYAPIVLFVYNRPDHLQRTVSTLRKNSIAAESELFIYSDGPKADAQAEEGVTKVRAYLKEISGFKNITITESRQNKGLANSVIHGVTEIVNRYGKVIVLEDDLETSPDFLRFMNDALCEYENEQQVMQISGHMFNVSVHAKTDAVFLPFATSWGWATWKRAWNYFDPSMSGYKKIKNSKRKSYKFNLDGTYDYCKMLERQLESKIDSWAIRWYLSIFLAGGLVLYPEKSLVCNIGFDELGTHAKVNNQAYAQYCSSLSRDKILFPSVEVDLDAYRCVKSCLARKKSTGGNASFLLMFKKTSIRIMQILRLA